jgi:ribosomal protein L11
VANINKGSSQLDKIIVGHVTNFQLEEITSVKMQDLNTKNLITAKKIIEVLLKMWVFKLVNNN